MESIWARYSVVSALKWDQVPYTDADDYLRAFRDYPTEAIVLARPALWVCNSGTSSQTKWIPWSGRDILENAQQTIRTFDFLGSQDGEVVLTLFAALPFGSGTRSVINSLAGHLEVIPATFDRSDAAIAHFGHRVTSINSTPSTLIRIGESLTLSHGSVPAALPRLRMLVC